MIYIKLWYERCLGLPNRTSIKKKHGGTTYSNCSGWKSKGTSWRQRKNDKTGTVTKIKISAKLSEPMQSDSEVTFLRCGQKYSLSTSKSKFK